MSLLDSFAEFNETKHIDSTTLLAVLEESFRSVIAKTYGTDENFTVVVNPDKGDFEITRSREIVADGEVEDDNKQIALSEARKIEPDFEVGEEVSEHIDSDSFGRRAILTLRQTLASKTLELEHDTLYNKYIDRVGEIVSAEVYQTWKTKHSSWTTHKTTSSCPNANKWRATSSARATACKPSSTAWTTIMVIPKSTSHALAPCFCDNSCVAKSQKSQKA